MKRPVTRRRFLAAATGAAGLLILPDSRSAFAFAANERINLAVMGHMYIGGHFLSSFHAYDNLGIVALCDPDTRKIPDAHKTWQEQATRLAASAQPRDKKAAEQFQALIANKPRAYTDVRKMLQEMNKDIDAVVVSMYDYYHGAACGTALRAGKHVFCERPLGRSIRESRALRDLAIKTKRATSIRNPGNASNAFRRGVEIIREGLIGPVQEVHVWFDRGGPDLRQPPQGSQPAPEGLDWDMWLGPLAARPFHADWMAYAYWRETCNGGLGSFGPHASNLAFSALKVNELWQAKPGAAATIKVQAECPSRNRLSFPKWQKVRWDIPARGDLPPVPFHWYDGAGLPPGARDALQKMLVDRGIPADEARLQGNAGAIIVGSKGVLTSDDHNVKIALLPTAQFKDVRQDVPKTIPLSRGHYADWLIHCRGGEPAWANFTYANALSEILMLGNVANQFDGPIEYDPVAGKILNNPEADKLLDYQYRAGWEL